MKYVHKWEKAWIKNGLIRKLVKDYCFLKGLSALQLYWFLCCLNNSLYYVSNTKSNTVLTEMDLDRIKLVLSLEWLLVNYQVVCSYNQHRSLHLIQCKHQSSLPRSNLPTRSTIDNHNLRKLNCAELVLEYVSS